MSFVNAKEHLKEYGLENKIIEFSASTATVSEAARAIGCKEAEIAKTLSFIIEDRPILIVTSGDVKIDNAKFKSEFHTKAKMIPFDDVEKLIGHSIGGVCPFGVNDSVLVYLDVTLKNFDTVYPAAGSSKSAVKLTLVEFEKSSNFQKWVDVCKNNL